MTGTPVRSEVPVGDGADGNLTVPIPAYADAWTDGLSTYLSMLVPRLYALHRALAEDGCLFFHADWRVSAAIRLVLDEIFGADRLVNEIVWTYGLGNARARRAFPAKHDTILFYAKSDTYHFEAPRGPVTAAMETKYRHQRPDGSRFMRSYGKEYDLRGGKPVGTVWDLPSIAPTSRERTGYPTQKPERLLERIILAVTTPGDLVFDPFCGSGTTLAVAERLGRRWVGSDTGPLAIRTCRNRLRATGASFDISTVVPSTRSGVAAMDALAKSSPPPEYAIEPAATHVGDRVAQTVELVGLRVVSRSPDGRVDPRSASLIVRDGVLTRVSRSDAGTTAGTPVTRHWTDWLEGWAIGHIDPRHGFVAQWDVSRSRDHRTLPLRATLPETARMSPEHALVVRVSDLFGRWWVAPVQSG